MSKISITVNGKLETGEAEARTLLSQFLRETLDLTGTHVGCDTSQCGACVVLVGGVPIKSCTMFAVISRLSEITALSMQPPDTLPSNPTFSLMTIRLPAGHGDDPQVSVTVTRTTPCPSWVQARAFSISGSAWDIGASPKIFKTYFKNRGASLLSFPEQTDIWFLGPER